jgi:hypothetical protein
VKTISKAALATTLFLGVSAPASAAITITDYLGNLGGLSYSVVGNNITIDEIWNSATPVFLKIEGLDEGVDYTVTKNITNNTALAFTSMANELLDPSGQANDDLDPNPQPGFVPVGFSTSNDNDGLSFAQGSGIPRVSSVFGSVIADELTDVRDFLDFVNGSAGPGSMFSVSYGLRDNAGVNQPFLLAQRFNVRSIGGVPEPTTWAMLITGFAMAGGAMRRTRGRRNTVKVTYA